MTEPISSRRLLSDDFQPPRDTTVEHDLDALLRAHDDDDFRRAARSLCGSREFNAQSESLQEHVLDALGRHPTEASALRVRMVLSDPAFASLRVGERCDQVDRAAAGGRFASAEDLVADSGAQRPPGHDVGALSVGIAALHGAELAEIFVETGLLGVGIGIASPILAVPDVLHEIAQAHEEGERWGRQSAYGAGFVHGFVARMNDEHAVPSATRGGEREGVERAERLWDSLEPSQRAELRAMPPAERRDFADVLDRAMEALVIGGR